MTSVAEDPMVEPRKLKAAGPQRPFFEISSLLVILALSSFLNLWNLGLNSWANAYYSAAVQSGMHNAEAFFFGSVDWGNAFSVDKPPLSLWLIGLSVRIFGFNSWGLLLPQAILGVISTALTYAVGRRNLSATAGIVGALLVAIAPVAVLMSRYNNPDSLLAFLLLAAFVAALRACETDRFRWAFLCGVLLGLAFLTKQLEALLLGPALAVLLLNPWRRGWRRAVSLCTVFAGSFILVSVSWFAVVELVSPSQRPYLGSTISNSAVELTFGFNGLQRFTGLANPGAALIPDAYPSGPANDAGFMRLLNTNNAQEGGWFLPAAFISVALIAIGYRALAKYGTARVYVLACAAWFLTTYAVLSFMGNGFHPYYADALVIPLAILVSIGVHICATQARRRSIRLFCASGIVITMLTIRGILGTLEDVPPWLGIVVLAGAVISAPLIAFPPPTRQLNVITALSACCLLAAPLFSDLLTIRQPVTGAMPQSGAVSTDPGSLSRLIKGVRGGRFPSGVGALAFGTELPTSVIDLLRQASPSCTWAAAMVPAQSAAVAQLAANRPVVPLGGYEAADPWPTISAFKEWIAEGDVCYLVDQPALDPVATDETAAGQAVRWVRAHFEPTNIDGVVIYDLRKSSAN